LFAVCAGHKANILIVLQRTGIPDIAQLEKDEAEDAAMAVSFCYY
jgi:hypothetical protein